MDFIQETEKWIPASSEDDISWDRISQLLAAACFAEMKNTQQNPAFHGEGDVFTHTQMVCRELVRMPAFHVLKKRQQAELFLAALLHDIGKVKTTRTEGGNLVSPHHGSTGSRMAREFLWSSCGLCGTAETMTFRETV